MRAPLFSMLLLIATPAFAAEDKYAFDFPEDGTPVRAPSAPWVASYHRLADEGHLRGGAAGDLSALIVEKGFDLLDAPPRRVTSLDVPIPFSPPLEKAAIADDARIEAAVRELAGR